MLVFLLTYLHHAISGRKENGEMITSKSQRTSSPLFAQTRREFSDSAPLPGWSNNKNQLQSLDFSLAFKLPRKCRFVSVTGDPCHEGIFVDVNGYISHGTIHEHGNEHLVFVFDPVVGFIGC